MPAEPGEGRAADRSRRVVAHARAIGFDLVGIAPTSVPAAADRYEEAVSAAYLRDMPWLVADPSLRRDVRSIHPQARSVVVVGVGYWSDTPGYLEAPPSPDQGWISRYAQGKDYHVHVRRMLIRLARRFQDDPALGFRSLDHRVFVDTGPVLEKAFAERAGLGWIGKNTLLINRDGGSWYFLGVVLTPLDLAPDEPARDHCGTCRRCLDACPTGALVRPYVLDARRCISTWTIEAGSPEEVIESEALGQHVFGCDLCQDVCPWNRKAAPTRHPPLAPRPANVRPALRDLSGLDEGAFRARFPRSAVRRTDGRRLGRIVNIILKRNGR